MRPTLPASILAAVLCAAASLHAHDIAIFPTTDANGVNVEVKFGHPGDYLPAQAGRILELWTIAPNGEKHEMAKVLQPKGLSLSALQSGTQSPGTWIFATRYDNGFNLRSTDGRSLNTTKTEYPAATTATHNLKFGKALVMAGGRSDGFDRVVGHRLELVPQADPFGAKVGDSLAVKVLFETIGNISGPWG